MTHPKVSVLMPVYNGGKYLKEAIQSILDQTFQDYEFLILYDVSEDNSLEIIKSFKDPRIKLVVLKSNSGLSAALNNGISLAGGQYIARMDCDDISLPERLENQVKFMDSKSDIGISGTWMEYIDNNAGKFWKQPVNHERIQTEMLFLSCMAHPTVIMRKKMLDRCHLKYDENMKYAEDYDLWVRASKLTCIANLPEILLKYRKHDGARSIGTTTESCSDVIRRKQLKELVGHFSEEEYSLHASLINMEFMPTKEYLDKIYIWFNRLLSSNKDKNIYDQQMIEWILAHKWFLASRKLSIMELLKWRRSWQYAYSYFSAFTFGQKMKSIYLLLNMMLHDGRMFKREAVK